MGHTDFNSCAGPPPPSHAPVAPAAAPVRIGLVREIHAFTVVEFAAAAHGAGLQGFQVADVDQVVQGGVRPARDLRVVDVLVPLGVGGTS
jgi:hypothetical protein